MARNSMVVGCALASSIAMHAHGSSTFSFSEGSGLAGEAEFTLIDSTTLEIRLAHTSTDAPGAFDSASIILTSVSWDFGDTGASILGGSARIGDSSHSVNFSSGFHGAGSDVGGEWGYGNGGATGLLQHYISGNAAGTTAFGGANLDGPGGLNGPQAGLISNDLTHRLGGQGAIMNEIVVTLNLSGSLSDLDWLEEVIFEFGSDAHFVTVPAPASVALVAAAGMIATRRRR